MDGQPKSATQHPNTMEAKKKAKPVALREFHLFEKLPNEIQLMIWRLVLKPRGVHFFQAKKTVQRSKDEDGFGKLLAVQLSMRPKAQDTSMYRIWEMLDPPGGPNRVDGQPPRLSLLQRNLEVGMADPAYVCLAKKNFAHIDAASDLVVLDPVEMVANSRSGRPQEVFSGFVHCNPSAREFAEALFSSVQQLSIPYRDNVELFPVEGRRRTAGEAFMCFCPWLPYRYRHEWGYRFCPYELAAFLNLFKSLKKFFFLVEYKKHRDPGRVRRYVDTLIKLNVKKQHDFKGAIYHDASNGYYELPRTVDNLPFKEAEPDNDFRNFTEERGFQPPEGAVNNSYDKFLFSSIFSDPAILLTNVEELFKIEDPIQEWGNPLMDWKQRQAVHFGLLMQPPKYRTR